MRNHPSDQSRRRFLRLALTGAAALPANSLLFAGTATAKPQKISEDDPTAKALKYSEDASAVSHKAYKDGQNCANCQLYTASAGEDGWGACGAFGGKLVKAEGWCTAYVPAQ